MNVAFYLLLLVVIMLNAVMLSVMVPILKNVLGLHFADKLPMFYFTFDDKEIVRNFANTNLKNL